MLSFIGEALIRSFAGDDRPDRPSHHGFKTLAQFSLSVLVFLAELYPLVGDFLIVVWIMGDDDTSKAGFSL